LHIRHWGEFVGEKEDKYSIMLYTGGEKCWNGPDRQAKIMLECGVSNELVAASEPNRCEYAMNFVTPAVCKRHLHEEL
jgi:protein kinase C substrate 80K-H